jgi:hypothetical protein
MADMLELATANLLSPVVLFFGLGLLAAFVRSDLEVPQAVAKGMALYLMLAIGFKGGASVAEHGVDARLVGSLFAGVMLSFLMPLIAYFYLRRVSSLSRIDSAATAAHYGSISVVTLAVAVEMLISQNIRYEGYLTAVAAVMEAPAIISGLYLAQRKSKSGGRLAEVLPEVARNGAVFMLVGAFIIGTVTGPDGLEELSPFIVSPFIGVLCLFLLDMGLVAGGELRQGGRAMTLGLVVFGVTMPVINGSIGALVGTVVGLSTGGVMLLATLSASASYIAVPAAIRLALPEARPSVYLTLSLGITFPFNLILGLPLYLSLAQWFT